jgi:hypothetical protein
MADRKISVKAVLKNLSKEKQAAIIDHTDGRNGQKAHGLRATVVWLRRRGIKTCYSSLQEFRRWYLLREELQGWEATTLQIIQVCKEKGWIKTAEEEQKAGQIFFNRMALAKKDARTWCLVQRVGLVGLVKKKMKMEMRAKKEESAKKTEKVDDYELTADEKQARIRQILGTE